MEQAAQRDCGTSIHGDIHNPIRCVHECSLSRMAGLDDLLRSLPTRSARTVHPLVGVGAEGLVHYLQQLFVSQDWSDAQPTGVSDVLRDPHLPRAWETAGLTAETASPVFNSPVWNFECFPVTHLYMLC